MAETSTTDSTGAEHGPFHCAHAGMERVVLGAHDGVMSWVIRVGAERSPEEQRLVSLHERFHHELHGTTPWGLAMSAAAAGAAGVRAPAWRLMAEGCRTTHEAFATYFSLLADERYPAMLDGNELYLHYRELAAALGRQSRIPADKQALIVDALLRAAMAPHAVGAWTGADLLALRIGQLPDELLPDARLERIAALVVEDQGRFAARALGVKDDEAGQPHFRSALAMELADLGVPTLTSEEHRAWATGLTDELNALEGAHFELVGPSQDSVGSAFDDYQRERLRLHDEPLPLVFVSPEEPDFDVRWLARGHDVIGPHSWLVWMRGDLLAQQFGGLPAALASSRPLLGILAVDRTHGEPVARFWHFSALSPAAVAAHLRADGPPFLFFTTLATILDSDEADDFAGISPVFALIDQSLQGFFERTRERGATLAWQVGWLEGDTNVAVFTFSNNQLANVHFLLVASQAGYDAVLAWLLRQPSTFIHHDPQLMTEQAPYLDALLQHLIGSFRELSLFAGTPAS